MNFCADNPVVPRQFLNYHQDGQVYRQEQARGAPRGAHHRDARDHERRPLPGYVRPRVPLSVHIDHVAFLWLLNRAVTVGFAGVGAPGIFPECRYSLGLLDGEQQALVGRAAPCEDDMQDAEDGASE